MGCLKDIVQVANDSAYCNFAQLVTATDGTTVVPTLDGTDFFSSHMRKVVGIKKTSPLLFH